MLRLCILVFYKSLYKLYKNINLIRLLLLRICFKACKIDGEKRYKSNMFQIFFNDKPP